MELQNAVVIGWKSRAISGASILQIELIRRESQLTSQIDIAKISSYNWLALGNFQWLTTVLNARQVEYVRLRNANEWRLFNIRRVNHSSQTNLITKGISRTFYDSHSQRINVRCEWTTIAHDRKSQKFVNRRGLAQDVKLPNMFTWDVRWTSAFAARLVYKTMMPGRRIYHAEWCWI